MKFALDVVPFGPYADPRKVVELGRVAEEAGWDGLFTWDHLGFFDGSPPTGSPWITLAAVAATTSRLRIGPWVTPLPRRRIQVVAQELAGLDLLSGGRVTFGAGLGGVPIEFEQFGENPDLKHRAAMFEEGLPLLARLLAGERVEHRGEFYTAHGVTLTPLPVQKPRIPIWVGAIGGKARLRAANWDGWTIPNVSEQGVYRRTPGQVAAELAGILAHRTVDGPYDVAITGVTQSGETAVVTEYGAAGANWWLETISPRRFGMDTAKALRRVGNGPPR